MNSISQTPSIYQIRHIESGKIYVGSAINPRRRWKGHRDKLRIGKHHSIYLQHAWDKYGEAAFVFEIIEPVLFIEDLITREQHWITTLKASTQGYGYNRTPTAGSLLGWKQSDEQRARRSEQFKNPEFAAKYSAAQKARFANPEELAKQSKRSRTMWSDPDYRARMTAKVRESHADPDYRARAAAKTNAQYADPVVRKRILAARQATWNSTLSLRRKKARE